MSQNIITGNTTDGNGKPLGVTLDTFRRTAAYKVYSGTLSADTVLDVFTALGDYGTKGFIRNTGATNSLSVAFSVDGTTYGDSCPVAPGLELDFNYLFKFKKIKLIYSASTTYLGMVI